ncbi:hypothetical protein [Streptomyces diastatochromogenes]
MGGTENRRVYGADEPHGSQGRRPYGGHPGRRRGTVTTDDPAHGAKY